LLAADAPGFGLSNRTELPVSADGDVRRGSRLEWCSENGGAKRDRTADFLHAILGVVDSLTFF
jgi:hypothetical protein